MASFPATACSSARAAVRTPFSSFTSGSVLQRRPPSLLPLRAIFEEETASSSSSEVRSPAHLERRILLLLGAAAAGLSGCGPALADVRIVLSGIKATPVPCPEGQTTVTGGTSFGARCFRVTGDALNPMKQPVYNVDIFGRVYDAQGEPALDAAESLRIDTISEIPPGKSKISFQITVSESQAQLGPLELRNFKGTGYLGRVNNRQGSGRLDDIDFSEFDEEDEDYVP